MTATLKPSDRFCVLCGQTREQVKKLIIGVNGGICLNCVDRCNRMAAGTEAAATDTESIHKVEAGECILCGKPFAQVGAPLLAGRQGAVCSDCISLCTDIINNDNAASS